MLVATLGVVGAVIAALIGAWAILRTGRPGEAELELVGISATRWGTTLDLKLYNRGGRAVVLKRLDIDIQQAGRFSQEIELSSYLGPSAEYDVALPLPELAAGRLLTMDLSQVIPPGEADRFTVRLDAAVPEFVRYLYLIRLDLVFNANDQRVTSPSIAFMYPNHDYEVHDPEFLERHLEHGLPAETRDVLDRIEREYPLLVEILTQAEILPQGLDDALKDAQASLRQLDSFRRRLTISD